MPEMHLRQPGFTYSACRLFTKSKGKIQKLKKARDSRYTNMTWPMEILKNENMSNKELAEKLHQPIIRKFRKRKVHSSFIDNIWGADVAEMQLICKFNKGTRFLLCVIDILSKYAWVIPLKDKKVLQMFFKKS